MTKKRVATLPAGDDCCTPLAAAPLGRDEATALARGFAALGDPVRLQLLSLLAAAEAGEVCVCDLTEPVGKSQPTVSHHLKCLVDTGLLTREKRGVWAYYSLVPGALDAITHQLGTHLTAGATA